MYVLQESLATFLSFVLMYHVGHILSIVFFQVDTDAPPQHYVLKNIIAMALLCARSVALRGEQQSSVDWQLAVDARWGRLEPMVDANLVMGILERLNREVRTASLVL